MRIMVGVGHPKNVHFWRNIINNLEKDGHEVKIVARKKDITLYLLDAYGFDYEVVGENYKSLIKKAYGMIETDFKALKVAKNFKPDILAMGTPYLAQVSKLIRKPHIAFLDTEHATLTYKLTYPFTDVVCTPSCIKKKINPEKHVLFNGYMELAYLHPNYFNPDPSVLDEVELGQDKIIVLRFVSWEASHDAKSKGFDHKMKIKLVNFLKEFGKVFITSEKYLNNEFEKYKLTIPPEKFHSLLYYASLCVSESSSIAVESALLGIPTIHMEAMTSRQGTVDMTAIHGNIDELVNKYKLIFSFSDQNKALEKAIELLSDAQSKEKWKMRRENLLKDKIDVTAFMTDFIERYPRSFAEYKKRRSEYEL